MTWEEKCFPDLYKERLERGTMRLGGSEAPGDRVPAHRHIRPGHPGPPRTERCPVGCSLRRPFITFASLHPFTSRSALYGWVLIACN